MRGEGPFTSVTCTVADTVCKDEYAQAWRKILAWRGFQLVASDTLCYSLFFFSPSLVLGPSHWHISLFFYSLLPGLDYVKEEFFSLFLSRL